MMLIDKDITEEKITSDKKDGFDLSFAVDALQGRADIAIKKIKASGKRPIQLVEEYLDTKVRDDPLLVRQLLRIYFSTYTDEPINAGLLAPSSEGKTYATVQVAELFPKEDVIFIGKMSPTALIHNHGELVDVNGEPLKDKIRNLKLDIGAAKAEGNKSEAAQLTEILNDMYATAITQVDLTHKILLFLDNPRPETYETLKPIMSHDKKEIVYKTTKSDGSLEVKETVIKGWPVFVVCSAKNEAKNEVWAEVASREVILSPNTSISKYLQANRLTSNRLGVPSLISTIDSEKNLMKFYVQMLKESIMKYSADGNPVINPFREIMGETFPHNEGITMRHYKRLMSFVNVETQINAYSNMKIEFELRSDKSKKIFLIASLSMIQKAVKILGDISTVPPEKIKFYNQVFVPLIEEQSKQQVTFSDGAEQKLIANHDVFYVTSKDLAEKYFRVFHKPINPKQVTDNYLAVLAEHGVVDSKENPDNRRQNLYYISSKLSMFNLDKLIDKCCFQANANEKYTPNNRRFVANANERQSSAYIWSCLVKPLQLACKIGICKRIFDNDHENINFIEFNKISVAHIDNCHANQGGKNDDF